MTEDLQPAAPARSDAGGTADDIASFVGPLPTSTAVCLVSMPFAPLPRPLPSLGLLKAALGEAGIDADTYYFNLWFAKLYGSQYHDWPYKLLTLFFGDWLFAAATFGESERRDAAYLKALSHYLTKHIDHSDALIERVIEACTEYRKRVSLFVRSAAHYVRASGARIVGCSSNFQQHGASLALLREVRRVSPGTITILGGANCEGPMGLATHRCFPWVDYVVSGEGEGVVVPLVRGILAHGQHIPADRLPAGVWGPEHRSHAEPVHDRRDGGHVAVCSDLNAAPIPDYRDYFDWLARLGLSDKIRPGIPIEGSRGCWWGRCSFCGLNGERMQQRAKTPQRLMREIAELEARHQCRDFELLDNVPPLKLLRELTYRLTRDARRRRLFCEVRAGLSRQQVEAMSRAGIKYVQAGIEGLNTEVLNAMKKGVKTWQNIQLLKWTREFGILCTYNLLWGLPGENDQWYAETAALLPSIEHLAPGAVLKLRFDRFSDYHRRPSDFGLRLRPHPVMSLVYPLDESDLQELSYFFEDESHSAETSVPVHGGDVAVSRPPGVRQLCRAVKSWIDAFFKSPLQPILALSDRGDRLEILDTRSCASERWHYLAGPLRSLYLLGDGAPRLERIRYLLERDFALRVSDKEVEGMREELRRRRLVLELDGRLVSLAIPGEQPALPSHRDFPGGRILHHWQGVVESSP